MQIGDNEVDGKYSLSHGIQVYLQAYEPGASSTRPLVAFVSFYRGQSKAFETQPIEVADGFNNRLKTMPLQFELPLNTLAAGRYECQVTVLDPTGQKAAFWQAPVMIVP
jgi:hypothetical protein